MRMAEAKPPVARRAPAAQQGRPGFVSEHYAAEYVVMMDLDCPSTLTANALVRAVVNLETAPDFENADPERDL